MRGGGQETPKQQLRKRRSASNGGLHEASSGLVNVCGG